MTFEQFRAKQTAEEKAFVLSTLQRHKWVLRTAAADLGIYPSTLHAMINRLDLRKRYDRHNKGPGRPKG